MTARMIGRPRPRSGPAPPSFQAPPSETSTTIDASRAARRDPDRCPGGGDGRVLDRVRAGLVAGQDDLVVAHAREPRPARAKRGALDAAPPAPRRSPGSSVRTSPPGPRPARTAARRRRPAGSPQHADERGICELLGIAGVGATQQVGEPPHADVELLAAALDQAVRVEHHGRTGRKGRVARHDARRLGQRHQGRRSPSSRNRTSPSISNAGGG